MVPVPAMVAQEQTPELACSVCVPEIAGASHPGRAKGQDHQRVVAKKEDHTVDIAGAGLKRPEFQMRVIAAHRNVVLDGR